MKILIADDHELYRDALALLVGSRYPDCTIMQVASYDELVSTADSSVWDAFLVDLNMPGLNYDAGIRTLHAHHPNTPIIVITSSEDPMDTQHALQAGALGYILKSMKNDEILNALDLIMTRGISIHPAASSQNNKVANNNDLLAELTPRQHEVLRHMCQGASNKRIALDMELSESTVKIHVRSILRVLQVSNRTEAVVRARELLPSKASEH